MLRSYLVVIAALAAVCLFQQADARMSLRPVRRSIIGNTHDDDSHSSKLNRRWWFGWSVALSPLPRRDDVINTISPATIFQNPATAASEYQRNMDRLAKEQERLLLVSLSQSPSSNSASDNGATR